MDLDFFRTVMTVAAFLTFVGIVAWAYSARRKRHYEEASRMALDDDKPAPRKGNAK